MNFHQFEVRIRDRSTRRALTGDEANAYLVWNEQQTPLAYDPASEAFVGDEIEPGRYRLHFESSATEILGREVRVDPSPTRVTFWTGPPRLPAPGLDGGGAAYLLGVLPHPEVAGKADTLDHFAASASLLGLDQVRGWTGRDKTGQRRRLAVFSFQPPVGPKSQQDLAGEVVATLLANEDVAAAGPFFGDPNGAGALLTQQIYLHLTPGASLQEAREIAEKQDLTKIERLPVGEDFFIATLAPERAFEIEEVLSRLQSEPRVLDAEPVPVAEIETDCSGNPCEALWDRRLVGAEDARALLADGKRPPLIALVDIEWRPAEVLQSHPELRKANGSKQERVVASVRFESVAPVKESAGEDDDEAKAESHALMCAGIAAGCVSGVAPESGLLFLKDPHDDWVHVRGWLWAGGWPSLRPAAGIPNLPAGGADIFCASIGRPEGVTEVGKAGMRQLVVTGRRGRGCPLFFSAGNVQADIEADRGYASLPFTLAIAASTYDSSGNERFSTESAYGDVELCAPSGTPALVKNSGGRFDGVLAPELPHCGTYPFRSTVATRTTGEVVNPSLPDDPVVVPVVVASRFMLHGHAMLVAEDGRWASREVLAIDPDGNTLKLWAGKLGPFIESSSVISATRRVGTLARDVTPASTSLELEAPPLDPLEPGQKICVGKPGTLRVRDYTVLELSGQSISVDEKLLYHRAQDAVFLDESHWNLSKGTSTATPLCAGTAALMLQANPRLSWVEVRHLLRTSAVKIDPGCNDAIGQWLGRDGRPTKEQPLFSRRYGFGRLDAREAVRQAIAYDFPRDLMIRQSESDDGGPRTGPLGDSPDIWLRSRDRRLLALEQRSDSHWHEPLVRSRESWVFACVRNRGPAESLEGWVRFYVAAGQEEPYCFPEDFELRRAEVLDSGRWRRGTQFLDEVKIVGVPPGEAQVVAVRWDAGLIPPAIDSEGRPWDPHILVAISPLDGPEEGVTMLDCNNLAQRAIQIQDFSSTEP